VDEPLAEPTPVSRTSIAEHRREEPKRRKASSATGSSGTSTPQASGQVRKRVSDMEAQRLEREALKYLRAWKRRKELTAREQEGQAPRPPWQPPPLHLQQLNRRKQEVMKKMTPTYDLP
jgi:hypothetical protein